MVVQEKGKATLKCLQQKTRASGNNYNEKRIIGTSSYRKQKRQALKEKITTGIRVENCVKIKRKNNWFPT